MFKSKLTFQKDYPIVYSYFGRNTIRLQPVTTLKKVPKKVYKKCAQSCCVFAYICWDIVSLCWLYAHPDVRFKSSVKQGLKCFERVTLRIVATDWNANRTHTYTLCRAYQTESYKQEMHIFILYSFVLHTVSVISLFSSAWYTTYMWEFNHHEVTQHIINQRNGVRSQPLAITVKLTPKHISQTLEPSNTHHIQGTPSPLRTNRISSSSRVHLPRRRNTSCRRKCICTISPQRIIRSIAHRRFRLPSTNMKALDSISWQQLCCPTIEIFPKTIIIAKSATISHSIHRNEVRIYIYFVYLE